MSRVRSVGEKADLTHMERYGDGQVYGSGIGGIVCS